MRDFQRQRVYNSEFLVGGPLEWGKRLETVPEMQVWVDKITRSRWFRNRWPYLTYIEVRDGRGRKRPGGYANRLHWFGGSTIPTEGTVTIPRWCRCEMIVIHEMTHVVTDHVYKRMVPSHGIQFCNLYLSLVRRWMGKEWHSALKGAFKIEKVKYRMVNV